MDKTPGQALFEAMNELDKHEWRTESREARKYYEDYAAAVIAHVRPQIEAEARAKAVEDAKKAIRRRAECVLADTLEVADACDAVSGVCALRPGHVVVPADSAIVAKPLEWAETNWMYVDVKENAREIWNAARQAERSRCAKVCRDKAASLYDHAKGPYLDCAKAIENLKD